MQDRGEDKSGRLGTGLEGLSLISPRNSKFKTPNPKQIQNLKFKTFTFEMSNVEKDSSFWILKRYRG